MKEIKGPSDTETKYTHVVYSLGFTIVTRDAFVKENPQHPMSSNEGWGYYIHSNDPNKEDQFVIGSGLDNDWVVIDECQCEEFIELFKEARGESFN